MQKRIAFVGLKKQTAKGSPGSTPATFGFGIRGGGVIQGGIEQESDAITYSSRLAPDENRTGINPSASISTRLYPRSSGLLLFGALGTIVTTGTGPYTHVITPGDTLPYLTAFTRLDTEYHRLQDAKVNDLTLAWTERAPVEVEGTLMGGAVDWYTSAWTATNDEGTQAKFVPPGGTFKLHGSSATPATAPITAGSVGINNNLVPIPLSKSVTPDDIFEAEQVIDCSFTLMPENTMEFRRAMTGADAGTASTGVPVYGSFEVRFEIDATTHLVIAATRVAFFPEYPEADPSGGPAELTMVGRVKKPAGAGLTATLTNAFAAY